MLALLAYIGFCYLAEYEVSAVPRRTRARAARPGPHPPPPPPLSRSRALESQAANSIGLLPASVLDSKGGWSILASAPEVATKAKGFFSK